MSRAKSPTLLSRVMRIFDLKQKQCSESEQVMAAPWGWNNEPSFVTSHEEIRKAIENKEFWTRSRHGRDNRMQGEARMIAARRRKEMSEAVDAMLAKFASMDIDTQEQSPLFNIIPPEIRNTIFALVLTEQDGREEISNDKYWYRPDYAHQRFIDVALLRTCRRCYLETRNIPQQNYTCRFWIGNGERAAPLRVRPYPNWDYEHPPSIHACTYVKQFENFQNIPHCHPNTIQLFPQMFALEGHPSCPSIHSFWRDLNTFMRPKELIINLRYSDWWNWEIDAPLRIDSDWTKKVKLPSSMEKLTMEFETRNGKKAELDNLVKNQFSTWRFLVDDMEEMEDIKQPTKDKVPESVEKRYLIIDKEPPRTSTWIGTTRPGAPDATYAHHSQEMNGTKDLGENEMLYYIVKMVWRREKLGFAAQ